MRVTYRTLRKILGVIDKDQYRPYLRRIFSFEENFDTFCYYCFPHAARALIPKFHYHLHEEFLFNKRLHQALAAPRGFAKSTLLGLFYISWMVVNKKEDYIVYMSQSHSKTVQFIEPLIDAFKNNIRLKQVYGDLTPSRTKDDDGKFREDIIDVNKIRIQGASFEKNIRGFKYGSIRPTLIVLDDIESDERVLNPELRLKDANKLNKIIIPSLDAERGRLKMIGTILHWDSLLSHKIKQYGGEIYKACQVDENNNIILGTSLWPEYWTDERLAAQKKSMGSVAFSSEYLNNPIQNDASLIKFSWLKACMDTNLSYEEAAKQDYIDKKMGVDFAFGDRAVNDKSAFVGVGKKEKYTVFQIETRKGMSITEQFRLIEQYCSQYHYKEVVLEENSIKGMSKELYNYSFNYYLIWTGAHDPADKLKPSPEFEKKRHTVGKKNMIMRLSTQFENNNIILPYKTDEDKIKTNMLVDELMTFALDDGKLVEVGKHADIPIGLAMAMERFDDDEVIILF